MDGAEHQTALRPAAVTVDAETLDRARLEFHRRFPRRSAKRVFYWTQIIWLAALGYGLYAAFKHNASLTLTALLWLAYALFATATLWRLYAAANLSPVLSRLGEPANGVWPTYTLLCPLYREASIVADLVAAIDRLDYPRHALDVKLLVEGDDVDTITAALAAVSGPHTEVVIVPPSLPRTKPKALNVGLALARGDFLCVYDAEDRPHPLQLRASVLAFEDGGEKLACVQAPLVIDNASTAWISRQFAAEYAIQFREIVPVLARLGLPLALGGSSNHFRTAPLRAVGGWDPFNVSEDHANFANKLNRFRKSASHIPFVSHSCASAA